MTFKKSTGKPLSNLGVQGRGMVQRLLTMWPLRASLLSMRVILKRLFSRLGLRLLLVSSLLLTTGQAFSQTEFQINASSADLQAEYQKELDKWMLSAYEGDKDAQFKVGVLFSNSQFGEPDVEQASYWYTQAARQGHVLAQYNLGHQYLTGTGVKRDEKTAMQWWLKAAEQQHPLAQFNVGRAYYMGIGLDKDLSQAKLWFQRASQNKEPKSTELLKQLGWWDSDEVANVAPPTAAETPKNGVVDKKVTGVNSSSVANANTSPSSETESTAITAALNQAQTKTTAETDSEANHGSSQIIADATMKPATIEPIVDSATAVPVENDEATLPAAQPESANPVADGSPQIKENDTAHTDNSSRDKNTPVGKSVAVFTNPSVRSVLITIVNDATDLTVLDSETSWSVVQSNSGFPVWVSKNFVRSDGSIGTITANTVNARSVPMIAKGSVVGRLQKNETLAILDQRGDWYRVQAPKRFKAWVKSADLKAAIPSQSKPLNEAPVKQNRQAQQLTIQNLAQSLGVSLDDNEWLFQQDEQRYALQLASFRNPELVKRFVESLPLTDADELRLFTTKSEEGGQWTYLVYGQFPNSDAAKQARTELKQKRAWVRRIGMLQQNRCIAWKKELPAPKELNQFCI